MNLASTLLTLALLGMDDPTPKPGSPPNGSAEIATKVDGQTATKAAVPARIDQGVKDLQQVYQAGLLSETLRMPLPKLTKPRTHNDPEAGEAWPMTLQSAIRIGLDNSEIVRVIAFGAQGIPIGGFTPLNAGADVPPSDIRPAPIVIARLYADRENSKFKTFKAEVMAHVRSVEQVYWALAQAHVQLWAADRAVGLAAEVHKREKAELNQGRARPADVYEASQRLEQFNHDLVTRTSDVITCERQLRFLLGLPPTDNRRIIPVTPATEAKLEPVWDQCLNEMLAQSPDIVEKKTALRKLRDAIAVASAKVPVGLRAASSSQQRADATKDAPSRDAQWSAYLMLPVQSLVVVKDDPEHRQRITQQEAELEQAIRQQVHALARFFLEIDTNHKQFQTAKRLTAAAAARLDAQRACYEEGRITIDRFLDVVSQYATAVGTEAQLKSTYNTAIVALKEVKGTLLADYGIVVAEPKPRKAVAARQAKTDAAAKPTAFLAAAKSEPAQKPAAMGFSSAPGAGMGCCESTKAASTKATKGWTFSFTIGSGPNAVQLKGTISADDAGRPSP